MCIRDFALSMGKQNECLYCSSIGMVIMPADRLVTLYLYTTQYIMNE